MRVHVIMAVSIDGFISRGEADDLAWSGEADKAWFTKKTKEVGVAIMGNSTFKKLAGPLKERLNIVYTSSPKECSDPMLRFTNQAPAELIQSLANEGYKDVCLIGGSQINSLFLRAGLITDLWISHIPVTLNGAVRLFAEPTIEARFELADETKLDAHTTLAHYTLKGDL